jgi:hypothetical protein
MISFECTRIPDDVRLISIVFTGRSWRLSDPENPFRSGCTTGIATGDNLDSGFSFKFLTSDTV